ncbi:MAG: NUDIX hydrolase [Lachnospiraceae bacterium]|nr:NUDIX hydrolase [Lachnospiraceae bacterium]
MDKIVEWAKELQSLAQAGLFYGHDIYDKERYQRIREISAEMMLMRADVSAEKIRGLFCNDEGYQTPKVDTRAAIFSDGKILLVCEKGKWSMPGGWCEFNLSPADNIVKETKEEAGLDVHVKMVISVQDRDKHNLPPYAYGVVKIFYLCEVIGGEFIENIETSESRYFSKEELPELAEEKCNKEQILMCFEAYQSNNWTVIFD